MTAIRVPAVYMRGGTSRGLVFHQRDLPRERAAWEPLFLGALGSPDSNGRQLNGMGGGLSSLSKVVVVGPPSRADADVDYTFAQVLVDRPLVDYGGNCGNMSSTVGPFAVDEGLFMARGDSATIRIHNTNTGKIIVAEFPLANGRALEEGDYALQGVAGTGARIKLAFTDPGGAVTGRLLPTGNVVDHLTLPDGSSVEVSIVDATNAGVFVRAADLGCVGNELPAAIERNTALLERLEAIRAAAAVRIGLAATPTEASARSPSNPKIALVAPPMAAATLAGERVSADAVDVTARVISMGQPHRAIALTGAMCLAVAARIEGTIAHQAARPAPSEADVRIGHPSGVLDLAARVVRANDWRAESVVVYRTARRLMEGAVLIPSSAA